MLLEIIILALAFPVGFLLAYMTKEELVQGRKWFRVIIIVSILGSIWFFLTKQAYISLTLLFILIATFVSYIKSFDKKWTKGR